MRNQGLVYVALAIIVVGVLLLAGNLFNLNLWAICFPVALILLGLFVIFRPRTVGPDVESHTMLFGDFNRAGPGELRAEEFWGFIVDGDYDLTKYDIPPGETIVRGYCFISDVEIFAPADLGVAITGNSFVTEFKLDGGAEETYLLSPFHWKSDGYKLAERQVRFELTQFIGDIKLRRF